MQYKYFKASSSNDVIGFAFMELINDLLKDNNSKGNNDLYDDDNDEDEDILAEDSKNKRKIASGKRSQRP